MGLSVYGALSLCNTWTAIIKISGTSFSLDKHWVAHGRQTDAGQDVSIMADLKNSNTIVSA